MTPHILLVNLGTPLSPSVSHVREYLNEFLMDPQVIDIPFLARAFLVKGIILNTRPKKSAHAYKQVWTDEGSPLLVNSQEFFKKIANHLQGKATVSLAMRYGSPSIGSVISSLSLLPDQKLYVIPLYPQYSLAATQSVKDEVKKQLTKSSKSLSTPLPQPLFLEDFFSAPEFIDSFSRQIKAHLESHKSDFLLFSYHGLPERQISKIGDQKNYCEFTDACCAQISEKNRWCYRAQCFETTRLVAQKLNLPRDFHTTSFQSRLGRTKWITPYTDEIFSILINRGVKRLAVTCPSFVADCLETLEEIQIRAKRQFIELGGEDLTLVPSLNAEDHWVKNMASIIFNRTLS